MKNTKTKNKVMNLVTELSWLFQFQNYEWSIVWKEKDDDNKSAEIEMENDYQRITISIYPVFFTLKQETQRKDLVHELCHFLIFPLHDFTDEVMRGKFQTKEHFRVALEKTTSQIENLLDSFLRNKKKFAKQAYKNYLA